MSGASSASSWLTETDTVNSSSSGSTVRTLRLKLSASSVGPVQRHAASVPEQVQSGRPGARLRIDPPEALTATERPVVLSLPPFTVLTSRLLTSFSRNGSPLTKA